MTNVHFHLALPCLQNSRKPGARLLAEPCQSAIAVPARTRAEAAAAKTEYVFPVRACTDGEYVS